MRKKHCPQCELAGHCTECIYDPAQKPGSLPHHPLQGVEVIFQKLPPIKNPRA